MKEWLKRNASLQNALSLIAIVAFVGNVIKGPSLFVYNLTQDTSKNAKTTADVVANVEKLTIAVDSLSKRMDLSERNWMIVNELVAKEFPRRSELEPRLRAIEEQTKESNMLSRRLLERYGR